MHHETSRRHDHRRHPHVTGKRTHLPTNTHLLERPKGAQRHLLCCGETPDARDIESLVGLITNRDRDDGIKGEMVGEMVGDGLCFLGRILLYL